MQMPQNKKNAVSFNDMPLSYLKNDVSYWQTFVKILKTI